jgi:Saxitoxin biosynthesis operon protein SxtJ
MESTGVCVGHESYERQETVEGASNRSFGIVFAIFFAVIGCLPLLAGHGVRIWSLVVSPVLVFFALLLPSALAPLNRAWLWFGLRLHGFVSPIALGIMFFLVITPMGLAMRAIGKDPLRLKFDEASKSYWVERTPPGPPPESFTDQF